LSVRNTVNPVHVNVSNSRNANRSAIDLWKIPDASSGIFLYKKMISNVEDKSPWKN